MKCSWKEQEKKVFKRLNEKVVCSDGFTMSVQAGETPYCTPRETDAESYTEVEVGFPNREESMLAQYAEDPNDLTGTVYAWVPRQTVVNVIAKHGGMYRVSCLLAFPC